jgi:ribonucleoside-diphosphate reductase alpha chain
MAEKLQGFHRKLYLTRYARKSLDKAQFIIEGSTVVTLVKDGKYPVREIGTVKEVIGDDVVMYLQTADGIDYQVGDIFVQKIHLVDALLETEYEQTADRVAKAISSVEKNIFRQQETYKAFKHDIENFLIVPSGRILNGAGDDAEVTLFNCYVVGVDPAPWAEEKGRDSRQAIAFHQAKIEEIMARGGGVGTCLDVFRPRYSTLSKTKGQSAGAVYIGNRFSSSTDFVNQGNRRGAQMLTMSDWHGDVFYTNDPTDPDYNEDFIGAKRKVGFMEGNNSSVLVSDAFMDAVEKDSTWDLIHPDTKHPQYDSEWDGDMVAWKEKGYPVNIVRTIRAKDMWDKLQEANHSSAEPGIIYIDRVNAEANKHIYSKRIKATNPCGEQPIDQNSTCNLSAVNFGRMVKVVGNDQYGALYEIDWDLLKKTIWTGVRFLDNVISASFYFDQDMKEWQQGERRVGLGGLGVADLFIALRVRYGSDEGNEIFDRLMEFLRDESYKASISLAVEKGSFPFFDRDIFLSSEFTKRLPKEIRESIHLHGIRNLTLNTFAPTGTTGSLTPSLLDINGSVSTGIEPHFAMKYERMSRIGKTIQYAGVAATFMANNPDVEELPDYYVGSMDLLPIEHVTVQSIAQKYIDSAISKTVNAPNDYTVEQCAEVYMNLYKMGCKGGTIYRDGSRDEQILTLTENNAEVENEIAPVLVEVPKKKGKYDNWECGNCGSTTFHMVEGCPQCDKCGSQSCSI